MRRAPTIATPESHTMGNSLLEYLKIKVHPDIMMRTWAQVIVCGKYDRDDGMIPSSLSLTQSFNLSSSLTSSPPTAPPPPSLASSIISPSSTPRVSAIEKRDKPFNWQQPTTKIEGDNLFVQCFPGEDYIWHYACLIATYLSLNYISTPVTYVIPTAAERMAPFVDSNIAHMGQVDIVVLGYVDKLLKSDAEEWEGDENELFSWKKVHSSKATVAYLGCRASFWGDIAGNLIRAIRKFSNPKCVIYVGKIGGLKSEYVPNKTLATGSTSLLSGGELITWKNVLEPYIKRAKSSVKVHHGAHFSSPSVLDQNKAWVATCRDSYDFVDPEIGHMAKACLEGGLGFGYLHIVSNNLVSKYDADLSNERSPSVINDRKELLGYVQLVLQDFFENWTS
jgi:hypothetical protein